MSGTSSSNLTAGHIVPDLPVWGQYQRFKFSNTNPLVKLQAYSQFAPTATNNSVINIETRNLNLAGYRFKHTTRTTDTNNYGNFQFQYYVNDADITGTDIFAYDGTNFSIYKPVSIAANVNMNSNKIINLTAGTAGTDAVNLTQMNAAIASGVSGGAITLTGNVTGSGTVGTPFATTIASTLNNIPVATGAININSQNMTSVGNVGVGVVSPTLPMQFSNTIADCKICLYQTAANSFEVFGFGVTSATLKYSVANSASSHVFYCGASSTTSNEIFRIAGSGAVTLQNSMNMNTNQIINLAMGVTPSSTDAVNVSYLNSKIAAGTIVLTGNVTGSGTVGTSFATTIASTLNNIPVATGAININSQNMGSVGNIGVGVSSPTFPIHFPNTTADCKIALYPGSGNSFQCYGFGVLGSTLKYSVDSPASSHVFYCGASSTTSNELFRIHGSGYATVSGGVGTFYSRVPSIQISRSGTVTTTALTSTMVKLNMTSTVATSGSVQFTTTTNRITYTGSNLGTSCTGMVMGSATFTFSNITSVNLALYKNGSIVNSSAWGTNTSTSIPISVSLPPTMVTLSPGDYLEIWGSSTPNTTASTQDISLAFMAC